MKIDYVELTQDEFESKMQEYTESLQKFFDEGANLQTEILEQLTEATLRKDVECYLSVNFQ